MCERLAVGELDSLVAQLQAAPEIPVRPYVESPPVRHNIEVLLEAARTSRATLQERVEGKVAD